MLSTSPSIVTPKHWGTLSDAEKIELLYRYAVATKQSLDAMASIVQSFQQRLNQLERLR